MSQTKLKSKPTDYKVKCKTPSSIELKVKMKILPAKTYRNIIPGLVCIQVWFAVCKRSKRISPGQWNSHEGV